MPCMVGLDYCLNHVNYVFKGPRLGLGALARVLVVDSVAKVSRLPFEMNLGLAVSHGCFMF